MGNTQKLGTLVNGLAVDASGNITMPTNNVALLQKNAAGTGTVGLLRVDGSDKIQIGDGGTINPAAIYIPSGNLGIGTSSPSQKLSIAYSDGGAQTTIYNTSTGHSVFSNNTADKDINYQVTGTGGHYFATAGLGRVSILSDGHLKLTSTSGGGTNLDMYLLENDGLYLNSNEGATARAIYFQTGGTTKTTITGSGDLVMASGGQVQTTGGYYRLRKADAATTGLFIQKATWTGVGTDYSPSICSETGYGISFFTNGNGTERLTITSGGVICMNTTTAAGTLSLKAQSDNRAIFFQNPNGGDGSLWLYGASNSFDYKFSTWSQGSAFYLYNNGNYSFAGSNVSDRRLKENIESITYNAIEKIMQLVPKSYNMIAQPKINRNGFIAQEVKEILPDIITGTETDEEYLGLDYNGLLVVAIKAIQELKAEIEILKNK